MTMLFISYLMSLLFGSFFSIDIDTPGLNFSMILFEKGMLCHRQRGLRYQWIALPCQIMSDLFTRQSGKFRGGTDRQGRTDVPCLKTKICLFAENMQPYNINLGWCYLSDLGNSKLCSHRDSNTRTNRHGE